MGSGLVMGSLKANWAVTWSCNAAKRQGQALIQQILANSGQYPTGATVLLLAELIYKAGSTCVHRAHGRDLLAGSSTLPGPKGRF